MIAIIDYGAGNLTSVKKALDYLQADPVITADPKVVQAADKIILPGVGHFSATSSLDALGLRAAIQSSIHRNVPFLGICVGMQWMCRRSEEAPEVRGLGVYPGSVRRFPLDARVPHMGWNELVARPDSQLVRNLAARPFVYFAHSYYVPENERAAALCTYEVPYTAVLECGNVYGVQFHPEKSGPVGLQIVRNFLELPC